MCNHGWRYTKSSSLGDNEDFFRELENDVFSSFSNPNTYLANGTTSNIGFEIAGYNSSLKKYTLKVAVNAPGVLDFKPSKPQDLRVGVHNTGDNSHPKVMWAAAEEPDVINGGKFRIWRRIITPVPGASEPWLLKDSVAGNATQYIDWSIDWAGSGNYTARYKIKAVDTQSKESVFSDSAGVDYGYPYKVADKISKAPTEFKLHKNYPNPFNPFTIINYQLPPAAVGDNYVTLKVYDVVGREVVTLVDGFEEAGYKSVQFDGTNIPSGVYYYRLTASNPHSGKPFTDVKKLVLIK
jgi:hypothetical protein